ncbi:Reticulon-like 1-like protein [Cladobotryum mycophilum]|uniref:Reticulon-like protein n=1 Tax=Cladobotryum mycophilum TaxID=491253 RepID=A0ABR0T1X8_9HYPO
MADTAGAPAANGTSILHVMTMDHLAQTPTTTDTSSTEAANGKAAGQPLTHYHSLFSDLVSWKNPRDSGIAYAGVVTAIIATRYLPIFRWAVKLSWMTLALTVAAEVAGKTLIGNGLASQFRPRKYFTISKEAVDGLMGDVHELINFFLIEGQRIFFAENVSTSAAACVTAFLTYYLIKIVPYWGLAILGTTLAFFVPLVYSSNQELIDQHLKNASEAINAQTAQVRTAAQKQADHLAAVGKQYAGDYTGKVQDILRGRTVSPSGKTKVPEFPSPPTEEPKAAGLSVPTEEPVAAS